MTIMSMFPMNGALVRPGMIGLKLASLTNQSANNEGAFRQGRHSFMTGLTQAMQWNLTLEQVSKCLQAMSIPYPSKPLTFASYAIPMSVAYLASRQIEVLSISQIADFIQSHLSNLSLAVTVVATGTLYALGQTILATTALIYLTLGILDRYNILPLAAQKVMSYADFAIGNITGLYFGGTFIRLMCTLNLVASLSKKYFENKNIQSESEKDEVGQATERKTLLPTLEIQDRVSLKEIQELKNESECPVKLSHIQISLLPIIQEGIKLDDILTLSKNIDWKKHENVIQMKLKKDERWLQVERHHATPIEYVKSNLKLMIDSIKYRNILQGKPQNYELLEKYALYITQQLLKENEITQVDILLRLAIEGGNYCGAGKFQVIEEIYSGLMQKDNKMTLKFRVLSFLQQDRQRIWQNIYMAIWKTNPLWQIYSYLTDPLAVHNANLFINFIQAGPKFGIPHQTALNDQTASFDPTSHYFAYAFKKEIEKIFWQGAFIPQNYIEIKEPIHEPRWKLWKWVHLKKSSVLSPPYDSETILKCIEDAIFSGHIGLGGFGKWWDEWIDRQTDLSQTEKDSLKEELECDLQLKGEDLMINSKPQLKFIKAMLIEMGILDKPENLLVSKSTSNPADSEKKVGDDSKLV